MYAENRQSQRNRFSQVLGSALIFEFASILMWAGSVVQGKFAVYEQIVTSFTRPNSDAGLYDESLLLLIHAFFAV